MERDPASAPGDAPETRLIDGAATGADFDAANTQERSAGSRSGPPVHTPLSRPLDVPAPETVLRRSELDQTRKTAVAGIVFNLIGLATVPILGGDPSAKDLFAIGVVIAVLNNALLLYASSSEKRYRDGYVVAYFVLAPFPNAAVLYYLGVFGPLLGMFVLNIYTACVAYRRRLAQLTLVASVLPPAILGGAMTAGWLADPGLVTAGPYLGTAGKAIAVTLIIGFMFVTYQQANRSRELLVMSLLERDTAVRQASHREALLIEARNELEQALHSGGLGRFSHQTLGSFKLGAIIGRGGMGEVYEAVHKQTGEAAAVKMLLPSVLGRPEYVRRFLREVRVAASLDSPHVVAVLEVGDESAPMPYLAMERLLGETLAERLRRCGRLDMQAMTELLSQTARGLAVAADAGVVHRDLKPQNLFAAAGHPPTWKILDFGISKLANTTETLTRGCPIGTPEYMAPEQARGGTVDARTDLYALGAITYLSLTGQRPFTGDESAVILVKILEHMPPRPSSLADLPADIDLFMAIAMAKDPDDRFESAAKLLEAFIAAAKDQLAPPLRLHAEQLLCASPWGDPHPT